MLTRVLSLEQVSKMISWFYENSCKPKEKQEAMDRILTMTSCSRNQILRVRNVLRTMNLLITHGTRKYQTTEWNKCKATPNPSMLKEVYRIYTMEPQSKVKVAKRKTSPFESALMTLVNLGYTGVLTKSTVNGYATTIETVDLSKIKVEE